jgi:DNA-binding transcriptional MocR family regulator
LSLNGSGSSTPSSSNLDASIDLAPFLQYSATRGNESLLDWIRQLTATLRIVPQYQDWDAALTAGSGDAIDKTLRMLCKLGDSVLVDAFTFPSTLESMHAIGARPVGVAMDSEGMRSDDLAALLDSWDEARQGPKPRSMCE